MESVEVVPPTVPIKHIKNGEQIHTLYTAFINFIYQKNGPPPFCKQKRGIGFAKKQHIIRGEVVDFIFDFLIETVFEGAIGGFWNDGSQKEKAQAIFTGVCGIIVLSLCIAGLFLTIRAKAIFASICFSLVIVLLVFVFGVVIHHLVKADKKK